MDYLEISELYHHGIKGQKWGVRRYQNEDGTLTKAGKAKYGSIKKFEEEKDKKKENMKKAAQYTINGIAASTIAIGSAWLIARRIKINKTNAKREETRKNNKMIKSGINFVNAYANNVIINKGNALIGG